jgi:hypothetical protein
MIKAFALLFLLSCTLLSAAVIPVFIDIAGVEAPNNVPNSLPVTLERGVNRVFIPFNIPTANSITALRSVDVSITVRDDDDSEDRDTFESGSFSFGLSGFGIGPMPIGFFEDLDGSSQTFSGSITDPFALLLALFEMQDNNRFQIRIDRCCGDFVVEGVNVVVNTVPEPSTFAFIGVVSVLWFLTWSRRRLAQTATIASNNVLAAKASAGSAGRR